MFSQHDCDRCSCNNGYPYRDYLGLMLPTGKRETMGSVLGHFLVVFLWFAVVMFSLYLVVKYFIQWCREKR